MFLGKTFPLKEIKKHIFSKIAIIFISVTSWQSCNITTVISGNTCRSLEGHGGKRFQHNKNKSGTVLSTDVTAKHHTSGVCGSAGKVFADLLQSAWIFFFSHSDSNSMADNVKDAIQEAHREVSLYHTAVICYNRGQIQHSL